MSTRVVTWSMEHDEGGGAIGYRVTTTEAGEIVGEYIAGNNRHDSAAYAVPGAGDALPPAMLRRYAEQTAREIAAESGSLFGGKTYGERAAVACSDDRDQT